MRRGTTSTLTFTTSYEADMIDVGYITFTKQGKVFLDVHCRICTDDDGIQGQQVILCWHLQSLDSHFAKRWSANTDIYILQLRDIAISEGGWVA